MLLAATRTRILCVGALLIAITASATAQQPPHPYHDDRTSYTFRKRISDFNRRLARNGGALALDEMNLCDKQIGCAGVTFMLPRISPEDTADTSTAAELLQVMVHNYLPPNLDKNTLVSTKGQVQMHIARWERRRNGSAEAADSNMYDDDNVQPERNEQKADADATTEGVLVTYQSKKPFIFHRGRVVADPQDEYRRTVPSIGLQEAKSSCQEDKHCVAISFPIVTSANHLHLSAAENVTFVSKVMSIDREDGVSDEWRSYISNEPS